MKATDEQQAIINCKVLRGNVIKVIAGAGTGKTFTLVKYAEARPNVRCLYLCFNKGIQTEASSRFPRNVQCRTGHSMAWSGFGSKYKHKLVPGLKANLIMAAINLPSYEDAKHAIDTLTNFLQSASDEIQEKHLSQKARGYCKSHSVPHPIAIGNAIKLWACMRDVENNAVGMIHDGYLKLWQLSNPQLNYDVIMLDEAQDTNPPLAKVFTAQERSVKILVGDSHQQIYSFRGSKDFIEKLDADHTFYLSQSFRFPQKIADIANLLLGHLKNETKMVIKGMGPEKEVEHNRYTVIARTNGEIFSRAARLARSKRLGFIGGIQGYRFFQIQDVYFLYARENSRIRDRYIASFGTFAKLKDYATAVEDKELLSMAKVVEEYKSEIPNLVSEILAADILPDNADVTFTTAHKAKGLEFDSVRLADDFQDLVEEDELVNVATIDPDEINLVYVAVTRAKYELIPAKFLTTFINHVNRLQKAA